MTATQKVVIGIYIDAQPELLSSCILSIVENTINSFELILIIDHPNQQVTQTVNSYAGIRKLWLNQVHGRAAGFNQLVQACSGDVYIFIENGVQVGANCIDKLIAALNENPQRGIAGPSTNRCWNEQGLLPHYVHSLPASDSAALELEKRYSSRCTTLEPLYSLSDFCYAVSSAVIATLGAADQHYDEGSCWEMDYNIRAARAGFQGVWVAGAFAYRPETTNRLSMHLDKNKQYYQHKFCSRQQRPDAAYNTHCRGDSCQNFARKITTHITFPVASFAQSAQLADQTSEQLMPLISCIMPTRGRPQFVAQAIYYFLSQDYPRTELIIAYETASDLPVPISNSRIHYVQTASGSSIGSKRNAAVQLAHGSIIAQWDDDDWYAPTRLSVQAAPLLHNMADISGLKGILFLNINFGQYWQASPELFRRLFAENVCGGTLMYWRTIWMNAGHYPSSSLREDADFMLAALKKGARLCRIPGLRQFVYIRHNSNTWKFNEGQYLLPNAWSRIAPPEFLGADRQFYASISHHNNTIKNDAIRLMNKPSEAITPATLPLVSCIMPTSGRRHFLPHAITHFLKQNYPNKELIIVDDGKDPVVDIIPEEPNIRYQRLLVKASVGAKRNIACEMAQGSIIVHWDDDDWMSPDWLSLQVGTLRRAQADVCGLDRIFFHAPTLGKAWQYIYDGARAWVCGGTLCYTKQFWQRNKFPDIDIGEDNAFVWSRSSKNIVINPASSHYIATIHDGNTSPKQTRDRRWHSYPLHELELLLRSGT